MDDKTVWAPADSESYNLFWQAAVDADLQRLETALKPHVNVNAMYGDGFEGHTVLHEAASRGSVGVTRFLLARGAFVNILDQNQFGRSTPLFYAARRVHVDVARVLLSAGADISIEGSDENTILSAVLPDGVQVEQGHMDTLALLLDHGFDINERASPYGPTVLEQGIKTADLTLIKMLLDRGATLEGSLGIAAEFHQDAGTVSFLIEQGAKDTNGYALSRAACWNKVDIARVLLAHASKPVSSSTGALQKAAHMGHSGMVNLLLNCGLDINGTDDLGQTPLLAASSAERPFPELVQMLLSRGADTAAKTVMTAGGPYQGGDTPLHASAWSSNTEIVRLLLDAGADANCRNDVAETPLIKFALRLTSHTIYPGDTNSRIYAFRMLLEAGSDVNASDIRGRTALHILAADRASDRDGNRIQSMKLLLARGIDLLARNVDGKIAADLLRPEEIELAQLLH